MFEDNQREMYAPMNMEILAFPDHQVQLEKDYKKLLFHKQKGKLMPISNEAKIKRLVEALDDVSFETMTVNDREYHLKNVIPFLMSSLGWPAEWRDHVEEVNLLKEAIAIYLRDHSANAVFKPYFIPTLVENYTSLVIHCGILIK